MVVFDHVINESGHIYAIFNGLIQNEADFRRIAKIQVLRKLTADIAFCTFQKTLFSIILVELAIELLRIATIHTPDSISNTMGMIAAILLGEFAIELGFFSGEILLFVSIGNVCDFATPNYELSLTNKYVKIFMILFSGLFGWLGFIAYQIILYMYLISLKPFGFSYLYPLIPFNGKDLLQFIIREPKK